MTVNEYRRAALAQPEAVESAHMNHPDFRVRNKIFATIYSVERKEGMVKLTPEQQRQIHERASQCFQSGSRRVGTKRRNNCADTNREDRCGRARDAMCLVQYRPEANGRAVRERVIRIAIAGGGAAGFFAAIAAARANRDCEVQLFERTSQFLSKVRISGGGRCNVTHALFDPRTFTTHYPRGERELISAFHRFSAQDTVNWFSCAAFR